MKRLTVFCLSALLTGTTFTATSQKTLIPNNTEVFKLSLETHGSYNEALSGETERDRFLLNDFKLEATGTVLPWLSYAYRQVLCYRNEWVRANGDCVGELPTLRKILRHCRKAGCCLGWFRIRRISLPDLRLQ